MFKPFFYLGLTDTEVSVYIFLAGKGPQKAGVIGNALRLHKRLLYRSLRKMQSKGIIAPSKYSACFSAVPFEKVLDLVIKSSIEEAERMMKSKKELLSSWHLITQNNSEK